jgi:hypothetical protein
MTRRVLPIFVAIFSGLGLPLASAQMPDVASSLVSYQFLDSLATTPSQPNVVSSLVSYQYFDSLGEENLIFEFSPLASYYFGGGASLALTGTVRDSSGQPVPGAEVIIQRYNTTFWHGYTTATGTIPAPDLPAGNFNIVVIKAGYTSLFQNIPGNAGGPLAIKLTLHPVFTLPDLVTVDRAPEETAIRQPEAPTPPGIRSPAFKVFSGTSFSSTALPDPSRMTIVISHGWNPGGGSAISSWATTLAYQIANSNSLGANAPNIVVWDWSVRANALLPPIDEACLQGESLGMALHDILGANYSQRVHFIGHSLGSIVNSYACDYVHGTFSRSANNPLNRWDPNLTKPHVTILDEAEIASVFGQNVATAAAIGWQAAQVKGALLAGGVATARDWKNPVPNSAAWTDNYISLVGIQRSNVVNIALPAAVFSYDLRLPKAGLEAAHAYAHLFYRNSIDGDGAFPQVGYKRSYESSLIFPPSGSGMTLGSLWYEDLATPNFLDLRLQPNPQPFEANIGLLSYLAVSSSTQVVSKYVGEPILKGYEVSLNWVGDLGGAAIVKTGQVVSSVGDKVGNLWDAALDKASTVNPETLFTGSIGSPSLRLLFSTPAQLSQLNLTAKATSASAPAPPQAWIPVHIPADAGFLVFDFTVTGEPADDLIACAINEKNLFTLPARFVPDGSPVSTDFLDISAYAGQEVELYFGLVGGTSSGCTLAIDGIRFVIIPTPQLAATVIGNQVQIQWPAAASGWVPQRNPGLDPDGWEDITFTEAAALEGGVMTWGKTRLPTKEFFRLRRTD